MGILMSRFMKIIPLPERGKVGKRGRVRMLMAQLPLAINGNFYSILQAKWVKSFMHTTMKELFFFFFFFCEVGPYWNLRTQVYRRIAL